MAVRWPMVGVKTLTGCSSVFLYWEFRVKSLVVILSSAEHQLVTRHNTTLSLVALLLPSFFYGLSLNLALAFGTLECVYGDWRTWLSAGVGGGCVWKQYVTSFGTPFPLLGGPLSPTGRSQRQRRP